MREECGADQEGGEGRRVRVGGGRGLAGAERGGWRAGGEGGGSLRTRRGRRDAAGHAVLERQPKERQGKRRRRGRDLGTDPSVPDRSRQPGHRSSEAPLSPERRAEVPSHLPAAPSCPYPC